MKINSGFVFYVFSICAIIVLLVLIILPFNINNLEQAQRIAQWKSEYENLKYCFSLVDLHENSIIPTSEEAGVVITDGYILERLKPYFNLENDNLIEKKRYKYRRMNGRPIDKKGNYYYNKFLKCKDGAFISVKKNESEITTDKQPYFYMFVDINGTKKPNRIGQDIFFINIFRHHISALGHDISHSLLKTNCSPIASGVYCSEFYLLGGRF